MTERQKSIIIDFFLRRVGVDAVNTALGFDIDRDPAAVFGLLDEATRLGDAGSVEFAVAIAWGRTGDLDVVPTLIDLLRSTRHKRHEDVALWLQTLRDPRAIEALYSTALSPYEYLEFDGHALARKCTWALADIGTVEAKERLRMLAGSEDPEIASYAQRRLDNWTREADRKGPHPTVV
jgi:hypothetical protein